MEPIREGLFEISEDGSGYLLTTMCLRCKVSFFPRRTRCICCLKNDKVENTTLNSTGKLYTYSIVHRSAHLNVPYIVGYVDFEEAGVRVFSQLTGCKSEELEIGMEMKLVFEGMDTIENDKRKLVYKFRPLKLKEMKKL